MSRLKQCPYDLAIKCIMDEECEGCEHYIPPNDEEGTDES